MARNLYYLFTGALLGLGIFLSFSEDKLDMRKKIAASYPNARFLSQVDTPGGASAIFLCENGKLIIVVSDRVFHSSITHENDNFSCK